MGNDKDVVLRVAEQLMPIEPRHLLLVAQVHCLAFPNSAMTRLGCEVVRRYYLWQLVGPHNHQFVGYFESGSLLGYAVGGISRAATAGFVRRNLWFLGWKVLTKPWLWNGRHFRGRLKVATRGLWRHPAQVQTTPQVAMRSFGVLAIAVNPQHQGKGIGKFLMCALEAAAREQGYPRVHLTVAADNTQAIAFYERLGWRKVPSGPDWGGRMEKELLAHPLHDPAVKCQAP